MWLGYKECGFSGYEKKLNKPREQSQLTFMICTSTTCIKPLLIHHYKFKPTHVFYYFSFCTFQFFFTFFLYFFLYTYMLDIIYKLIEYKLHHNIDHNSKLPPTCIQPSLEYNLNHDCSLSISSLGEVIVFLLGTRVISRTIHRKI